MSIEKARDHYLGKNGCAKANCAQALVYAFKDKLSTSDNMIAAMAAYGGGRAPEGVCGAFYAARTIAGDGRPDKGTALAQALLLQAGSIKCKEIRSLGKLSCVGCVETMAACLDKE